jgi:hypothetical protein
LVITHGRGSATRLPLVTSGEESIRPGMLPIHQSNTDTDQECRQYSHRDPFEKFGDLLHRGISRHERPSSRAPDWFLPTLDVIVGAKSLQ